MVINDARQLYVPFLYRSEDYVANGWFIVLLTGYDTAPLVFLFDIHFFLSFLRVILQNYIISSTKRKDWIWAYFLYDLIGLRSKWISVDRSNRRYRRCMQVRPFLETNCRSGMPWPDGNRVSIRRTIRSIVLLRRLAG